MTEQVHYYQRDGEYVVLTPEEGRVLLNEGEQVYYGFLPEKSVEELDEVSDVGSGV